MNPPAKVKQEYKPKIGDRRTRRIFAWWPIQCNSTMVWLESYVVEEEYQSWEYEGECFDRLAFGPNIQTATGWVVIKRAPKP